MRTEVVVVGAGIVGSVIAYRLAQAGHLVTVVEARHPGAGTSGVSFAWLNSYNFEPEAYHQLHVESISEHRRLAEELDAQDCLHLDGGLAWEYGDSSSGELDRVLEHAAKVGYPVERVN